MTTRRVLVNVRDPDGGDLEAIPNTGPNHSKLELDKDGLFTHRHGV